MSSEQNVPEVQMHQGSPAPEPTDGQIGQTDTSQEAGHGIPHGMGQSKSSRRRRRKRKNKVVGEAGQQGTGQFVGDIQGGQGFAEPAVQPQNSQGAAPHQQAG